MQKPFYSEYLDTYLDGCQKLISQGIMTKEDAMEKIDIPLIAMNDLFGNRYNFSLTKTQTEKLFKEVDKMYFFISYTEEERQNILDSYIALNKRKEDLSPREFTLYKNSEGQLDRVGYFDQSKKNTVKVKP